MPSQHKTRDILKKTVNSEERLSTDDVATPE